MGQPAIAPPEAPGTGRRGCYLLRLSLSNPATIRVGRAGERHFPAGFYMYVGSAFGPGGVRARLAHHLRVSSKPHWHVDYLRQIAEVDQVWFSETEEKLEHRWAEAVAEVTGCQPLEPGLGASDCNCPTHLFYFERPPEIDEFHARLEKQGGNQRGDLVLWRLPASVKE